MYKYFQDKNKAPGSLGAFSFRIRVTGILNKIQVIVLFGNNRQIIRIQPFLQHGCVGIFKVYLVFQVSQV